MRDDGDDLAAAFAKEARQRQQAGTSSPAGDEPFNGIKEIVLDSEGNPRAIPRRPAPPPASSDETIRDLLRSPFFLFGSLVSAASLVLLLAIAQADANASL